jgi:hypothetical protein
LGFPEKVYKLFYLNGLGETETLLKEGLFEVEEGSS